eukprot:scaffold46813_cov38-Tisochrysis_lutea.AAC.13
MWAADGAEGKVPAEASTATVAIDAGAAAADGARPKSPGKSGTSPKKAGKKDAPAEAVEEVPVPSGGWMPQTSGCSLMALMAPEGGYSWIPWMVDALGWCRSVDTLKSIRRRADALGCRRKVDDRGEWWVDALGGFSVDATGTDPHKLDAGGCARVFKVDTGGLCRYTRGGCWRAVQMLSRWMLEDGGWMLQDKKSKVEKGVAPRDEPSMLAALIIAAVALDFLRLTWHVAPNFAGPPLPSPLWLSLKEASEAAAWEEAAGRLVALEVVLPPTPKPEVFAWYELELHPVNVPAPFASCLNHNIAYKSARGMYDQQFNIQTQILLAGLLVKSQTPPPDDSTKGKKPSSGKGKKPVPDKKGKAEEEGAPPPTPPSDAAGWELLLECSRLGAV